MEIEAVGIIGASEKGTSLAELLISKGFQVRIYDDFKDSLNIAMAKIQWSLKKQGKIDLINNIEPIQEYSKFQGADIVIETIAKTIEERNLLFRKIIKETSDSCIFAVYCDVFPLKYVLENISLLPVERTIGVNFIKPVIKNPLVEIIRTENTNEGVFELVFNMLSKLSKVYVLEKDNPGHIVERLSVVFILSAFKVLYAGKGFPSEIDLAFKQITGSNFGPFEYLDFIGIDHNYTSCLNIWEMLGKPDRLRPSDLEMRLVQYGQTGRKSTIGIYLYEEGNIVGENPSLSSMIQYLGLRSAEKEEIFRDIMLPVVEEAKLLATEIMASEYDIETAAKYAFGWNKGPFAYYREKQELFKKKEKSEFEELEPF